MTSLVSRLAHNLPIRRHTSTLNLLISILGNARSRRRLGNLDSRLLDDIGVNQADAKMESARSIWDVPSHWTH